MNSIFPYPGAKYQLAQKLVTLMPDHKCYVEPFGGSAAVLFTKRKSDIEIYNDIDNTLHDFFTLLQRPDDFQKLYEKLQITPYSRAIYNEFVSSWKDQEDNIEKVYRWYVVMSMSFSGNMGSTCVFSKKLNKSMVFKNRVACLPAFVKRLMEVQIDNRSWQKVLSDYDDKDTFFYVDPPYVMSTRKCKLYNFEFNDRDHKELVRALQKIKGKVMLSGYENKIYKDLDWDVVNIETKSNMHNNNTAHKTSEAMLRTECIWMNYESSRLFFGLGDDL